MLNNRIYTNRLILVPLTYDMVVSLLNGECKAIEKLGFKLNGKWPRKDTIDILEILERTMKKSYEPSGYDVWMIVRSDNKVIIGDIGFKGEPNERGEIEIGYGIVSDERNKGFGFEATNALIKWALTQEDVKKVKADCLVKNFGSIRILEKIGMKEISRDDELIYWEIVK
ncbi:GNAT family N-acetyltransferase [Mycoplasmatota bacterium]|nr:GNAT family N-acetyltransferase [Mycoplasmatota bacterium]